MKKNQLEKLGSSVTPPWILNPIDSDGADFRDDCLAWWLVKTKTRDELKAFLSNLSHDRSREKHIARIKIRIQKIKAWLWLSKLSRSEINYKLDRLDPDETQAMREQLNALLPLMKKIKTKES